MPKVFIGVGHGGKDPGAVANGLKEKDINLGVALSCAEELEKYNIEVLLSRYTDEDDSVIEEIKECNKFGADLAIDFHINAGGGDGTEIFHHSLGCNSKRLAQCLEEQVKLLNNSRGIKTRINKNTGKDYYAFIRDTNPPAVIVESAFIDNLEDIQCIDEEEEQKTFGKAYAIGILNYLGINKNNFQEDTELKELINKITLGINETSKNFEKIIKSFEELKIVLDKYMKGGQ